MSKLDNILEKVAMAGSLFATDQHILLSPTYVDEKKALAKAQIKSIFMDLVQSSVTLGAETPEQFQLIYKKIDKL